jgi:hypothetical protein
MFYLNDDEVAMLYSMEGNSISKVARTAIRLLYNNPYLIYKVTCKVNGRVYYGFDKTIDFYFTNTLTRMGIKQALLVSDIEEYGASAFDVNTIGTFEKVPEAAAYLDYVLNRDFDAGIFLYNQELYTGYTPKTVTVPIEFKTYLKLVEKLSKKKTQFKKVFDKFIAYYLK